MSFTIKEVAHYWDETAVTGYEECNARTVSYGRRFSDAIELIEATPVMRIPQGGRLIDVGCGTGNGLLIFHQRFGITCVGVDISQGMLEVARSKLAGCNLPIELCQSDGENLPFDDSSFDVGVSFEVLEHTPHPVRLLKELARVIKPGGLAIVTTPNTLWEPVHWLAGVTGLHHKEGPHRNIPRREILAGLNAAGLRIVAERTSVLVPAGPKVITCLGRNLEDRLPAALLRAIALRRLFLCACDKIPSS